MVNDFSAFKYLQMDEINNLKPIWVKSYFIWVLY